VDRLDPGQIHDADSGTVGGELPDGFQVGAAGVGIAMWELKKSRIACGPVAGP